MKIYIIRDKATPEQIEEMLLVLGGFIKVAVDVRRETLAAGCGLHADCEEVLLADGSQQDDLWGANWYPAEHRAECEAVMNIRPWLNNFSMMIQNRQLCERVCEITRRIMDVE